MHALIATHIIQLMIGFNPFDLEMNINIKVIISVVIIATEFTVA